MGRHSKASAKAPDAQGGGVFCVSRRKSGVVAIPPCLWNDGAVPGSPKKRARKLEQALRSEGIDPDVALGAVEQIGGGTMRAHARATVGTARTNPIGPSTRRAIDDRTVEDLDALARQLEPGLVVRLERLRPVWAAGWVEDYPIDADDLAGLLEHVAAEHGGQVYRVTVLASDSSQLFGSRIAIAGPPRRRGVMLPRAKWDGSDDVSMIDVSKQAPQQTAFTDIVQVMQLMTGVQEQRQETVLKSVQSMVDAQNKQIQSLLGAMFETHKPQAGSFRDQVTGLLQARQALDELQEVFASGGPPPESQQSPMQGAMQQAAAQMLMQGLMNDGARPPAPKPHIVRPQQHAPKKASEPK